MAVSRRWGLIPFWAKDPRIGSKLINARAESVATLPAFRSSFKWRRCLVIADGFYEWMKTQDGKQPFFIHLHDDEPFAFAGLYEKLDRGEGVIETATIITTKANDIVAPLHSRMPVILPRESHDQWLDPDHCDKRKLQRLLKPYPEDEMIATPVSTFVNSPKNDDACCVNSI
jgi:putative SOS response-associated peptidase YedK